MGLLSMFGQALTGGENYLGGLLGQPQQSPGMVTPPSAGGFNAPGLMPFGNMTTGQPPAPSATGAHPGGIMGFVQQQIAALPKAHASAPPLQTADMSHPDMSQPMQFGAGGNPMPGGGLRPVSGLQQMSGW